MNSNQAVAGVVTTSNIPAIKAGWSVVLVELDDGQLGVLLEPGRKPLTTLTAGWITTSEVQTIIERKTPGWAVFLGIIGIFFFLIGLLFFLVKVNVPTEVAIHDFTCNEGNFSVRQKVT